MNPQGNAKIKQVVCVVFYHSGKVLLEQRLDKDAYHKNWMFTGGKIEAQDYVKDNPIHAASVRESKEETGLTVIETKIFTSFLQELRDGRKFEFIGVCVKKWNGKLQNNETNRRNLAWIDINEAEAIIGNHEVDKRILKDFMTKVVA